MIISECNSGYFTLSECPKRAKLYSESQLWIYYTSEFPHAFLLIISLPRKLNAPRIMIAKRFIISCVDVSCNWQMSCLYLLANGIKTKGNSTLNVFTD